jgi:SAM-dependent methyltransferase
MGKLLGRIREIEVLRRAVVGARNRRAQSIDSRLGIRTLAAEDGRVYPKGERAFNDSRWYDSVDYPQLARILDSLELNERDTFFDVGCGMGRVVCLAARRPVRKVVGVELDSALAEEARRNAANLKGRLAPIEILACDAATADYSEGTAFVLFNPFGEHTMKLFIEQVRRSLVANPRKIRIAYYNPEVQGVLRDSGWLSCYDRHSSIWYRHETTLWRNTSDNGGG